MRPPFAPSSVQPVASRASGSKRLLALLFLGLAALCLPGSAVADQVQDGKTLFTQQCGGCHTLGGGDTAGPDLEGVVERSGEQGTRDFIADPAKVIASGDPKVAAMVEKFNGVAMPDLGLTGVQVDSIVAFLAAQGGATGGTTTTKPPATAPAGDVAAGKELFTGETQFANGGAACMSCHRMEDLGSLGGGLVGPDLTNAATKYGGEAALAAVMATLPFPTMVPVYDGHALTKTEQADLAAYMQSVPDDPPAGDSTLAVVAIGVAVALALLALAFLIWPRRRLVVRRGIAPTPTLTRRR